MSPLWSQRPRDGALALAPTPKPLRNCQIGETVRVLGDETPVIVTGEPTAVPLDDSLTFEEITTVRCSTGALSLWAGTLVIPLVEPETRAQLLLDATITLAQDLAHAHADGEDLAEARTQRLRAQLIEVTRRGRLDRSDLNTALVRAGLEEYHPRTLVTYTVTGSYLVEAEADDPTVRADAEHCLGHVLEATGCEPTDLVTGSEHRTVHVQNVTPDVESPF